MRPPAVARRDQGSGSLPVVLLLLVGAMLAWWYGNRTLLAEVKAGAAAVRATLAREAAEAGIAWTLARLHAAGPVDAACLSGPASDQRFIDRMLPVSLTDNSRHPGTAQPTCVLHPTGWQCTCPTGGAAASAIPAASDAPAPAFRIRFEPGPDRGQVWLNVLGCSNAAAPCLDSTGTADAQRSLRVLLGLLSALARPPYATVTALGDVELAGDVQVVNDATAAGWTIATAGVLVTDATARLSGPPGTPGPATAVTHDPRGMTPGGAIPDATQWFALHFALSPEAYSSLPHVHRLACSGACGSAQVDAAVSAGHRVLWSAGDLVLDTATPLGTPTDPVLLIVQGTARLAGARVVHGVLHAAAISWVSDAPALWRGALNSAGAVHLAGPLRLVRDDAVITRISRAQGSWAVAPGSWTDLVD